MASPETIEKRLQELRTLADDYAKARANTVYIEEFKKSKLALLMKEAERNGVKTAAAQERDALAHHEYIELLHGLRAATEVSERSRWLLRIAEMGSELYRTEQANQRAERKGYGA
jgi:hypothetical protein